MDRWADQAAWLRVRLHLPLALAYLWFAQPTRRSLTIATAVMVAGLWIRAWAAGHLRKYEGVTVTGPYAFVRHPLYLGTGILLGGLAVAAARAWLAVPIAAYFFAFFVPTLRREEEFQLRDAPDFYALYRALVPALIPHRWPVRFHQAAAGGSQNFQWGRYLHNREWQAAAAAAIVLSLLYAKMVFG